MQTVEIRSSLDGVMQPASYVPPRGSGPMPLLVALHQWSAGYDHEDAGRFVRACGDRGWAVIIPNFRGPNFNPQACASPGAVRDVLDAARWVCGQAAIDRRRIYVSGGSGGGFMSMVMAHRAPRLWAGVSAWAGISDLVAWHRECRISGRRYADNIEAVCGGPPGASPQVDEQYHLRSPLPHLHLAKGLDVDLATGIHDGHTGSVPVSHTLLAFNALARANGHPEQAISDVDIAWMLEHRAVPAHLAFTGVSEPRNHRVLLQRSAGPVRVTLFEGGHELDHGYAVRWLERHARPEEGQWPV